VLRDWVARLFGFDREIESLRDRVRELSWDDVYGMYTRPAFLQFAQVMPRGRRVLAFIDMDNIHRLDQELGYTEVDRRIRTIFSVPFRRSDVVARWYSGDEIVILFDAERGGAERKMEQLAEAAAAEGLSFTHDIGDWEVGQEPIEDVVEQLSRNVMLKKSTEDEEATP
jgi:GGDEF domain-containing protein